MENIDKIIFINLESRKDRLEDLTKQFEEFDFPKEKIIRVEGNIFPGEHGIGITKSHIEVIETAKKEGCKNVLVLEDDFEIIVSKEEFQGSLKYFFETFVPKIKNEWDVLMLAYNSNDSHHKIGDVNLDGEEENNEDIIGKVTYVQTASAFIVNSNYFDKLIQNYKEGLELFIQTRSHWKYAVDVYWNKLQCVDNWFFFKNRLSMQKRSYPENKNYNC